jgi:hypothetical protein
MYPLKVLAAAYLALNEVGPSSSLGERTRRVRLLFHEREWLKLQLPERVKPLQPIRGSGVI